MMPKKTTSIPNPPSLKNPHHPTNIAITFTPPTITFTAPTITFTAPTITFTAPTITNHPSPLPSGLLLGISGVLLIVFRRGSWSHGSFQGLGLQFMGVLFKAREMGVMFFFWGGWLRWLRWLIDRNDYYGCWYGWLREMWYYKGRDRRASASREEVGCGFGCTDCEKFVDSFFLVTLKELRKGNSDGLNVKHSLDLSPTQ